MFDNTNAHCRTILLGVKSAQGIYYTTYRITPLWEYKHL